MNISALMRRTQPAEPRCIVNIPAANIRPNPSQPRRHFESNELTAMAKSISQLGIIQPLTVREVDGGYELIAGERRLRAAKLAGLREVPCIIAEADPERAAMMALVENLQREDLNFFEQAAGFRMLIEKFGLTQQQAAVQLGLSQPTIANKLRLLSISDEQKAKILNFRLSERHARALLRVSEEERGGILQTVCDKHMTAEGLERYIDALEKQKKVREGYRKRAAVLGDVRLFFNTVEKALNVMRLAGVEAKSEKKQAEGYIEYVIKIPKKEE